MYEDDVIKEVRRIRDEIAAEYNYDVHAYAQALRERQGKDGRKVVSFEPQRITPVKRNLAPEK